MLALTFTATFRVALRKKSVAMTRPEESNNGD
jgi:hypothetical protein